MNIRFNKQVANIMKIAHIEAKDMGNNYVGSEHILLALMQDTTTSFSKQLAKQCVFYFQVKEDLMVLFGLQDKEVDEIQVTQIVEDIIERSLAMAKEKNIRQVDVDMVSLALLKTPSCVANEVLHRYEVNTDQLLKELSAGASHELDQVNELRNLNVCGNNREIVGREHELDLMISILSRKDKANPLLIGEPGVGKTALVERLAAMIEDKQVPESLQDSIIYELHLNSLVAGTKYRGDFEEKLQNLINLLKKYPNVILFVDEIHQMIGAGKSEGSIDVSSVLKPYLARGIIRCIGATTIDEYEKYMESDRALERRFQVIMIKEPDKKKTAEMIRSKLDEYEIFHSVKIESGIIEKIVDYCDYFMPQRKFPDKAMDVLDLACVSAKRKKKEKVDDAIVKAVIEQMTDIPISSKNRSQHLRKRLESHLFGQQSVIDSIMSQVNWMEHGVIQNRPLGVWLFLGHHGVGKNTCIKEFHKGYFNQEEFLHLDMSTFELHVKNVMAKLRRNPYTTLSITNLHAASLSQLQFLKQGIMNGSLEYDNQNIDLRHSIIIMSGDFPDAKGSMNFTQQKSWSAQAEKVLGTDFMKVFDEVMVFQDLDMVSRHRIVTQQLHMWKSEMSDDVVQKVLDATDNVEEACRILKMKIVNV